MAHGLLGAAARAHRLSTSVSPATPMEDCGSALAQGRRGLRKERPRSVLWLSPVSKLVKGHPALAGPIAGQTFADWKVANICL